MLAIMLCTQKDVLGYYRNDLWLDDTKGWTVAYHGTTASNVASIVREGLRVRGGMSDHVYISKLNEGELAGERFGTGIYVSYHQETAESYSREFKMNHSHYKVILQCRVRPGYFETTTSSRGILLINDERDVRLCGILIRNLQESERGKLHGHGVR